MKTSILRLILPTTLAIGTLIAVTHPMSPLPSLKDAYHGDFLIGTALSYRLLQGKDPQNEELALQQFSAFTPENSMKPDTLQRTEGHFNFVDADRLVELAEQNGAVAVGHTLIWHSQTPAWFFEGENGAPVSREVALQRMRTHIATVVGRYKGRVKEWDVVNEALSDGKDGFLRPTPWLAAIGDDYIAEAFRAAHKADPHALLIYNDYGNEAGSKRDKTLRLLKMLLDQGVPVGGVGMQCHWRLDRAPIAETEKSIEMYAALGLKVMVTEFDIGVLKSHYDGADVNYCEAGAPDSNPYPTHLPEEVARQQADLYRQSFQMFLRHRDVVDRVTLWGINDGNSWLNDFPVPGRTDYPLLFDREGKPKSAFYAVSELGTGVVK